MADTEPLVAPLRKPEPFSHSSADNEGFGLQHGTMANLAGLLEVVRWRCNEADEVDLDAGTRSRGSVSGN
jgi:hypothetical protein